MSSLGVVEHIGDPSNGDAEKEDLQSEFKVTLNYIAELCLTVVRMKGHRKIAYNQLLFTHRRMQREQD